MRCDDDVPLFQSIKYGLSGGKADCYCIYLVLYYFNEITFSAINTFWTAKYSILFTVVIKCLGTLVTTASTVYILLTTMWTRFLFAEKESLHFNR